MKEKSNYVQDRLTHSVRARAEGGDPLAHALARALACDAVWKDLPLRLDEGLVGEADVRLHRERIEVRLHRAWHPRLHVRRCEGGRVAASGRCARRGRGRQQDGTNSNLRSMSSTGIGPVNCEF